MSKCNTPLKMTQKNKKFSNNYIINNKDNIDNPKIRFQSKQDNNNNSNNNNICICIYSIRLDIIIMKVNYFFFLIILKAIKMIKKLINHSDDSKFVN